MSSLFRLRAGTKILRTSAAFVVACAVLLPIPVSASEPSATIHPEYGVLLSSMERLEPGASGNNVMTLQSALRDRGFYRGEINGEYDTATETAVITLHKYLGIERTSTFNSLDWIRIAFLPGPEIPYRWDEPDRVEIDTTRQLLFVIRSHQVVGILPTSTGSGASYYSVRQGRSVRSATPHGDFAIYWRQYGWNCDSTTHWCVYSYWGFTPFYGIHGYRNVPAFPASHGCARVHIWDSDWLDDYLYIGMPVHIWRDRPADETRPQESLNFA